jgi:hypothetical protein
MAIPWDTEPPGVDKSRWTSGMCSFAHIAVALSKSSVLLSSMGAENGT